MTDAPVPVPVTSGEAPQSQLAPQASMQSSLPVHQPAVPAPAPAQRSRTMLAPRDRNNYQSLGASLYSSIRTARVLMVGAGGIGCELLKNLVLSGYGEVHVVDLDTIDLSNLNRQFLFRSEHIKKPKALVAREAAQRFNPNADIIAHHANIKDSEYNVPWFRNFAIVFNALDNLEARRHVNKMCLAADVPLIESGTTGFNGQVQVIKKGVTACYDCTTKETPKTFPVCTIRSTPSQPIHCIVWGKNYLLNEMFGESEDQVVYDHSADAENSQEIEELKRESEALRKIREAVDTPEFPQLLFDKVFSIDIERLRSVDDMWKSRSPPQPLRYQDLLARSGEALTSKDSILTDDQRIWSLEENLAVFIDSLERLSKRMSELRTAHAIGTPEPTITFNKDDEDTLDFVASSANIRSHIFGIETKSRFDIKQMAGNIIPAIATTNAIVAGLCVLESFKILKNEYAHAKEIFLTPFAPARLLATDRPREPNPDCPVCGVHYVNLSIDFQQATLNDVVTFIRKSLGFEEREFVVNNDIGVLYDVDETDNLPKKLSELGIKADGFLTVIDDSDEDQMVNVLVNLQQKPAETEGPTVEALSSDQLKIPRKPRKDVADDQNGKGQENGEHTADAVEANGGVKFLKRPLAEDEGHPAKKIKVAAPDDSEVVLIEEEGGGAIVIDDD